jgi:hypothetical protein
LNDIDYIFQDKKDDLCHREHEKVDTLPEDQDGKICEFAHKNDDNGDDIEDK